jgi:thioesterase domain-containing protein/acyl carrier protein
VGTCAANRPLEEVEGLIGRFGNSMLLRTDLSGNPTFGEVLKRVREVSLNAWSHQELPLGMLMEAIRGGADRNRTSPFRVMFNLQNASKESWQLPGLSVDWLPLETGTSKLDLIVWLKSEPKLEITLEYSTQLFECTSMKRLLADYQAILEAMAKDPGERVDNVRIWATPKSAGAQAAPVTVQSIVGAEDNASVEAQMIELWQRLFRTGPIDVTKNFFELGGDSLLATRLFAQIDKIFQRKLPLTALIEAPTIKQLVKILCDQGSSATSCLVSFRSKGTRPPLFCLHGIFGEVEEYFHLVQALGDDQPVFGVRSPALEDLSRLPRSMEEAAAEVVPWIRKIQPRGAPSLIGYSWGGLLAFEVARQLAVTDGIQCFTGMVGTSAPMRPTNFASRLSHLFRYFPPWLWNLTTDHKRRWRRLHRWREMALATKQSLAEPRLPVRDWLSSSISRHLFCLVEKYHPPVGSEVTIDLFRELNSYDARAHPLQPWCTCHLPDGGWHRWVHNQPHIHWLDGDHVSIIKPPFACGLAQSIRSAMDRHLNLTSPRHITHVKSGLVQRT